MKHIFTKWSLKTPMCGGTKLPMSVIILDILFGVFMVCVGIFGTLFMVNLGSDLEWLFYCLAMVSFALVVIASSLSSSLLSAEIEKCRRETKAYFDRMLSKPQNEDEELACIEKKMTSIRRAKDANGLYSDMPKYDRNMPKKEEK